MELGLNGDFKYVFPSTIWTSLPSLMSRSNHRTAIAHCVREQVHMYQKSLFLLGHPPEGLAFQNEDLRTSFLPGLNVTAARSLDQVLSG